MLKKILLVLTLVIVSASAQGVEDEKYQINAKVLDTKNDIITAVGDVVIFSKTYFMTADKALYDRKNQTFELFDDVLILKNNMLQAQSNYAFINMQTDSMLQNPTLLMDQKSKMWINTNTSEKKETKVLLEDSILSSCDCEDPFWSLKFSSGDYDTEDKWVNTFNTRLYIKSVPVFYTPYFGFSADTTRRTGLLYPTVGYSKGEGVLYSQPLYIAPQANYDIELVPQIRSNRGEGINAYLRWADSQYSMLRVSSGIFEEQSDYVKEENLKNKKHFGWSLDYKRSKLFSDEESQDGLYINAKWLNDVELDNITSERYASSYNRRIESKLNYFYKTSEYFSGIYLRHYNDTSVESNDTTMQQLPQVQLHQFADSLFVKNLLYSTDFKYTNYTRQQGIEAQQYDINLPISYSFNMFNDYLRFTFKEEIDFTHMAYDKSTTEFNDGSYLRNRHIFEVGTDLLRPYENYLHTVNFSTQFIIPNSISENGDLYTINNNNTELATFPSSRDEKKLIFALNHSLYDREDLGQIINHKIKQSIIYDDYNSSTLGDLENEVTFNYILGSIYNRLLFSNQDNELIESSSGFSLLYDWFKFNATYYMSKDTPHSGKEDLESYTLATTARLAKDYALTYSLDYNIQDDIKSKEGISVTIDDRCWQLSLSFEDELVAKATSAGESAKRQNVFYINLILKPIGAIQQSFSSGN